MTTFAQPCLLLAMYTYHGEATIIKMCQLLLNVSQECSWLIFKLKLNVKKSKNRVHFMRLKLTRIKNIFILKQLQKRTTLSRTRISFIKINTIRKSLKIVPSISMFTKKNENKKMRRRKLRKTSALRCTGIISSVALLRRNTVSVKRASGSWRGTKSISPVGRTGAGAIGPLVPDHQSH